MVCCGEFRQVVLSFGKVWLAWLVKSCYGSAGQGMAR